MAQTTTAGSAAEHGPPVHLLWTGGWDSTFRLLQLLLVERRPVQPIYVLNHDRRSTLHELRTMLALREALRARMPDHTLLRPTTVVLGQEFPPRQEFVDATAAISARGHFGNQYQMLAGVAEAHGWRDVELCIERSASGVAGWTAAVFAEPGRLNGSPESRMFQFWSFPVYHLTKTDMGRIAREHGFYDLLVQRWFCHRPVMGKPCGRCRPCQLAVRDEVAFANPVLVQAQRTTLRIGRGVRRRLGRRPASPG